MIDFNKPSSFEAFIARVIGTAIGNIQAQQSELNASKEQAQQTQRRQDAELKARSRHND